MNLKVTYALARVERKQPIANIIRQIIKQITQFKYP